MSVRSGVQGIRISSTGNSYFTEFATTTLFAEKSFGFKAQRITVTNDATSTDDVSVSYDGATVEGKLKYGESKDFFPAGRTSVHIKAATGGSNVRLWAE